MQKFKKYIGLWLILAVGLIAVTVISFLDDIKIGDFTLKKAPVKETLLAQREGEDSLSTASKDDIVDEKKNEVDSLPQSLLIIGDSMTWNLALRLAEYAEANGHQIHTINWDSSNTKIWVESDTLQYFIKKYNATYIFISLGANELYLKKPDSHKKYVQEIIGKTGGLPYIWIGPPNWKEDTGLNDMIASACAPGTFFRTEGMSFKRRKDGIHPTKESSALWMDSVIRLMPKSAHPILMNLPPDTMKIDTHRKANITILQPKK